MPNGCSWFLWHLHSCVCKTSRTVDIMYELQLVEDLLFDHRCVHI